ncbi:MAG: hypothetical protein KY457_04565 [Actinobacteria bacterium]|nr:hypothetical protein [Actinomycetota bacterium]
MVIDRVVRRLRRRLDAGEPVLSSARGRLESEDRSKTVAVVLTDRRILVVDRRGEIRRAWGFAELPAEQMAMDLAAGVVRIGEEGDQVRVEGIHPVGQATALFSLARERLAASPPSAGSA